MSHEDIVASFTHCKQPPRPRWAWPRPSLEASELDPTDGKCQTGLFVALRWIWSGVPGNSPHLRLANCALNKNSFACHCTNTRQLQHGIKFQSKFLGEDIVVEFYLPLYLLVWGSRPIGSSLQQHTVFFDSGLVSRNNASTKSQAYWMNETWNKYNKHKQKTRHFSPYTSLYASSDARSTSGNSLVFDSPRHRCGSIHSAGAVLPPGNSTCHLWNSWNRRNQTHIDIFPQWT